MPTNLSNIRLTMVANLFLQKQDRSREPIVAEVVTLLSRTKAHRMSVTQQAKSNRMATKNPEHTLSQYQRWPNWGKRSATKSL